MAFDRVFRTKVSGAPVPGGLKSASIETAITRRAVL